MDFIKGADVSSLEAMEDAGAKYYDFDGKETDALALLQKYGMNYIRLRIWNQPTTSFDKGDYCNLEHTVRMAKRVKETGMKLLLDFHYSDSWADWRIQKIPAQWENCTTLEQVGDCVYQYTEKVLRALDEAGAYPDMVQVGNEIGKGLLWDFGREDHPQGMAVLLNRGIGAVRACDGVKRHTEIMLHIECGADIPRTDRFFTTLRTYGVTDYEVIGLSYYPYWAGKYEDFTENLRNLAKKFSQKVVVAETAFPYTDASHDDMPNVVTGELTMKEMGKHATPEEQKNVMNDVLRLVHQEDNGYGVFYWEPVWYSVPGVGACKGAGNEWENQALFDENGKPLEALRCFG